MNDGKPLETTQDELSDPLDRIYVPSLDPPRCLMRTCLVEATNWAEKPSLSGTDVNSQRAHSNFIIVQIVLYLCLLTSSTVDRS